MTLHEAIHAMTQEILSVLAENQPTLYLFGSVVLEDFQLGWSDIDIVVLTRRCIAAEQADALVGLRQHMLERCPSNPYFRLFEGGMLSAEAFFSGEKDTVVYWGTSGQRTTDRYALDSFAVAELLTQGVLLCGEDVRHRFTAPTHAQFVADIRCHYETIRQHGTQGWGWLLDIARGLYTLQHDRVIAKTRAGEWALENALCPVPEALARAVAVRKAPLAYAPRADYQAYARQTGEAIQRFADVLAQALGEA